MSLMQENVINDYTITVTELHEIMYIYLWLLASHIICTIMTYSEADKNQVMNNTVKNIIYLKELALLKTLKHYTTIINVNKDYIALKFKA